MGRDLIRIKKVHEPETWEQKLEGFMDSLVVGRGLDERTVKAYRMDLEHLYHWLQEQGMETLDEDMTEGYLRYLLQEKKLRASTVTRKYRVFKGYLTYLSQQGFLRPHRALVLPALPAYPESGGGGEERAWEEKAEGTERQGEKEQRKELEEKEQPERGLTRAEVDSFFVALDREYEDLDSDFRKRVCLRDDVMMRLLFCHGLDISEILRLELADYDIRAGVLSICWKRDKRKADDRDKGRGQGDGVRRIPIFSRELRERMELWIREHGYFERVSEYRDVLFLSKLGRPLSMKMVISIFDKYRSMAGIERGCTPKDLKKSMEQYARELMMERYS